MSANETTNEGLHPVVALAIVDADKKLAKAAPKIAKAQPKTSNAVLTLFKTIFLPMLTPILGALIAKYGGESLREYLEPARDILIAAFPLDDSGDSGE